MVVKKAQNRRQHHGAARFRFGHQDGDVADQQGIAGILLELDRAGTIEEGPAVAEIGATRDGDLGAEAAFAAAAFAVGGTAEEENAFEQCRLAAGLRSDQGSYAR